MDLEPSLRAQRGNPCLRFTSDGLPRYARNDEVKGLCLFMKRVGAASGVHF
jgi:hypothetical protein